MASIVTTPAALALAIAATIAAAIVVSMVAAATTSGVGRESGGIGAFVGPRRWGWGWVAVIACLPLGVVVGQGRTAALERSALPVNSTIAERATILELPRRDRSGRLSVVVELRGEPVLLRPPLHGAVPQLQIGRHVAVSGELRAPDLVARSALAHATLLADRLALTGGRRGGLAGAIDRVRDAATRALTSRLPAPEAGLFRGMVLGQDAALPDDLRDQMRAAGLSHLVAASGANIALLATIVLFACAIAGTSLHVRLWIALVTIGLYVPLAGGGPSIQRAGIMGGAAVVALLGGRPSDRWYALLLAAVGTLALDPRAVADPGWQMSFAAVVALLAWARRLADRLPGPAALAQATAMTVLATIATAPIAALHFETGSLAAVPANVLAAPVVAPIMWLGFCASAVAQLWPAAAAPLTSAAAPLLAYLVALGRHAADWPGAGASVSWPVATAAALGALGLVAAYCAGRLDRVRPRRAAPFAALAALALALLVVAGRAQAPAPPPAGDLRVTALDVGQGDAILVQSGAASVLFDAGVPGAPTVSRLRDAGVRRLDALVITHGDADHAGGAPAVMAALPVDLLVDGSGRLRGGARRVIRPQAGQVLQVGALRLDVLWPTPDATAVAGTPANDLSAVVIARAGRRSALLGGDAESEVLAELDLPDVDILKLSHHGSADPGLSELLDRVRPEATLISVGRGNDYGHPSPSTLAALRGRAVYRTDADGTVAVQASPSGLTATSARRDVAGPP